MINTWRGHGMTFIAGVPIVNRVNTTVTNLGNGTYRVGKTGGVAAQFDASAVSNVGFSGDFTLKLAMSTAPDAQYGWVGVNADPLTDNDYVGGDYGVLLSAGVWYYYESGVNPGSFADDGTPVWIRRVGTTLTYLQGATLATAVVKRTVNGVTGTMYFDSSIQNMTARLDVTFMSP